MSHQDKTFNIFELLCSEWVKNGMGPILQDLEHCKVRKVYRSCKEEVCPKAPEHYIQGSTCVKSNFAHFVYFNCDFQIS